MLARLLIRRAEDDVSNEGETRGETVADNETIPPGVEEHDVVAPKPQLADESSHLTTTFAKVDKSLISLGFFTPSSRRIRNQKIKRISFTRTVDARKVDVSAEFHPSPVFGLPITADQDKFLALHNIIANRLRDRGTVENPIRFTSAELLQLLNKKKHSGKNYKDIVEWLTVMTATTIVSEGTVFEKLKERYAHDVFHVFDRATSFGKQLPDGSIADANYVWLSQWQLENINQKFLLPVDLLVYRELKNHIAKALVPLLQIWLFASQRAGSFEKRYDELCEMLSLKMHRAPSLIKQQLGPSLNELVRYEYLEKWRIERTADKRFYKIILFHGSKFHRDRRRRLAEKAQAEVPLVVAEFEPIEPSLPEPGRLDQRESTRISSVESAEPTSAVGQGREVRAGEPIGEHEEGRAGWLRSEFVNQLSARGLMPAAALRLLHSIPEERLEAVGDYIDFWDVTKKTKDIGEGFLYNLIKAGDPLPTSFETRRQREERQERQRRGENLRRLQDEMKFLYDDHCEAMIDRFIAEELGQEEFQKQVEQRKNELLQQGGLWDGNRPEIIARFAAADVRKNLVAGAVVSYEDFYRRQLLAVLEKLNLQASDVGLRLVEKTNPVEPRPSSSTGALNERIERR